MSSFSVCAENVLIQNFFESDRLNSKYLFWNDMPSKRLTIGWTSFCKIRTVLQKQPPLAQVINNLQKIWRAQDAV